MVTLFIKFLSGCLWKPPLKRILGAGSDGFGRQDGLLWYKDFGKHVNGEFSMAVLQANRLLEDESQIESGSLSLMDSGPFGSFVGVYDGHGGPEAAQYITNHLFGHIKRLLTEQQSMSADLIRKAIRATEDGFFSIVSQQWPLNPHMAATGSCCLVGIVCDGTIYISCLGDSRAVLGRLVRVTGEVLAIQLSAEHNASIESIRKELQSSHPNDPQIVLLKQNVWRVKGLIQISRSIGDAFLKKAEFNREPLDVKFRLRETFKEPILSSEPSISVQKVHPDDQFIIFASDGLWEQISNQDAVNIVQNNNRKGIARRLVKAAIVQAAKKREMRYSDLMKIRSEVRRYFHDDITVTVLFLDSNLASNASSKKCSAVSLRGGSIHTNSPAPLKRPGRSR